MDWYEALAVTLGSVVVGTVLGAFLGHCFGRRGMKEERIERRKQELQDAVRGLLTEVRANLKLIEKQLEPGLLPWLSKDMWNIHKSRVIDLPFEIQESLYQAYSSIDKVNAVVQNMYAFGSRHRYGPGSWDTRYENEGKNAREPMAIATDKLEEWLKEQKQERRGYMDNTQTGHEEDKNAPAEEVTSAKIYEELKGMKQEAERQDKKHFWDQVALAAFAIFLVGVSLWIAVFWESRCIRLWDAGILGVFGLCIVLLAAYKWKRVK